MADDIPAELRRQVEEEVHRHITRLKEIPAGRADLTLPADYWHRHAQEEIAALLPFALEVWREGGETLPLSEDQLSTASIRRSMAKAGDLTRRMEDSLARIASPQKRQIATVMAGLFKRQNERMAPMTQDASKVTEEDLNRLAQEFADELKTATEHLRQEPPDDGPVA